MAPEHTSDRNAGNRVRVKRLTSSTPRLVVLLGWLILLVLLLLRLCLGVRRRVLLILLLCVSLLSAHWLALSYRMRSCPSSFAFFRRVAGRHWRRVRQATDTHGVALRRTHATSPIRASPFKLDLFGSELPLGPECDAMRHHHQQPYQESELTA